MFAFVAKTYRAVAATNASNLDATVATVLQTLIFIVISAIPAGRPRIWLHKMTIEQSTYNKFATLHEDNVAPFSVTTGLVVRCQ